MRGLKVLATLGLLIALTGWSVVLTERICTVGFAAEEFRTIKGAVIARTEIKDPSKPEYDPERYDPASPYRCDKILVGPGIYSDQQFPNDPKYNPNIEIQDRGKPLTIEPLQEGDVSSRILVGKVEGGKPIGQVISIIGSKSQVTIKGLSITQGITGILIQDSENVTLSDIVVYNNQETGISIQKSGNVSLEGIKVYNDDKQKEVSQQYGIRVDGIRAGQKVTIKDFEQQPTEVYANKGDGVFISGGATVELANAKVYENGGCGVRIQGASVTDPSGQPSNVIFKNKGGNTCPRELARSIRKPEILVPEHVKTLQEAITEAEFVQTKDDLIYHIVVNPEPENDIYTLKESLCIDRSIIIRSVLGITLRPANKGVKVAIASPTCPLREENQSGTSITIRGSLEGGITLDGLTGGDKADIGVQIGSHQNPLKVTLENVTIQNYKTGVQVEPKDKQTLVMEVTGYTILANADCTKDTLPQEFPPSTPARIQDNNVGISVNVPKQALVELRVGNTVINRNNSGLELVTEGRLELKVDTSWISNNTGIGLRVESKADQPIVTISQTRIWGNQKGGLQLKAAGSSALTVEATNTDIRGNGGFGGVHIEGPVNATMQTDTPTKISPNQDPKEGPHSCGISDNFGSGVRVYGPTSGNIPASVTIDNLHILGNGYTDKKRNNYISRDKKESWAGPDGIFAHGFVKLTVQNSHIGSGDNLYGNAGIGIALSQPSKPEQEAQRLEAKIMNNLIEHNGEWGVAHVVKICENIPGLPSNFYGKNAEGYGNKIENNRWRVQQDLGPQVCPPTLENLMQPQKP